MTASAQMQESLRCLLHPIYRVLLQEMKIEFTGQGRLIMLNDEANSDQITKWPLTETEKFLFPSRFFRVSLRLFSLNYELTHLSSRYTHTNTHTHMI